jgi:uncharacterized protein with ParB-like and HNH nuclease domain
MNITPNKLTIAQLFATTNEQFVVPAYQRRYAWGYNQTKALFDDIEMLQDNDGHLFGMLIMHTSLHQGGLNTPELVDGQQRITTLTILLKAIQNRYSEIQKEDKATEIGKMLICKGYDDVVRNKLVLGDLDDSDYKKIMTQKGLNDIQNQNLSDAYIYFSQWLEEFDFEKLNRFYFKLTNVAVLIRLDVGLAKDAYKLFETINNRGLKLSPTDIIKNFLLGHAAKIEELEIGVLDNIKSIWSEIIVNLDDIDTDDFFRQYMCSILTRKISKNKLVSEFKEHYFKKVKQTELLGEFAFYVEDENEDVDYEADNLYSIVNEVDNTEQEDHKVSIAEFLIEIRKASKTYREIAFEGFSDTRINKRINNLNRILSKPSYIFLMNFMRTEHDFNTKVELLKLIETFMLRRHICEMRTSEHDDVFSKMNKCLNSEDIIDDIKKALVEYYPTDDLFKMNFPLHQFKGKLIDRAKYVLEMIEYHLTGNTDEFSINQGNQVHLEHIVPQTIDTKRSKEEFGDWETYLGQNAKALHRKNVNMIGNMTLLAAPLNISASNNPFIDKKEKYTQSNIKITKDLESFDEFKFEQIKNRGNDFSRIALQIWKLN